MKKILFLLQFVFLFSCVKNEQEKLENIEKKPLLSVVKEHASVEKVNILFKKDVADWKELNAVNSFLLRFKKASPNEALSNALELRDLVKSLKDSVKPKIFDIPSFNARIHILENETLRLADLTFIPAITANEINVEVDKTIAAFSAVNSKINTVLSKKRFEDAIDVKVDFIGIDLTKIDSVSKKSIDDRSKEKLLERKKINKKMPFKKMKKR